MPKLDPEMGGREMYEAWDELLNQEHEAFEEAQENRQIGITTGFGNPRVSARVCLGLGYGLEIFTPVKTRTPATGWRV